MTDCCKINYYNPKTVCLFSDVTSVVIAATENVFIGIL